MNKEFSQGTVFEVQGNVEHGEQVLARTALHINFSRLGVLEPATECNTRQKRSQTYFNAIGSRCVGTELHLPVIDVDGGVELIEGRNKVTKAVVRAAYEGTYTPESSMRDLLGDHGIDLEVFSYPAYDSDLFSMSTHYRGMRVSALVLRAQKGSFDAVPSTIPDHSHLYINRPFNIGDHANLIWGLARMGVVSSRWEKMTKKEGMGIVRTPWTEKAFYHSTS